MPALGTSGESRPFRVLIVRTGAMGDVLHAMPAVAALRERHPEWEIGWAIEPKWRPLLETGCAGARGVTMPLVDRIHDVPTGDWNRRPVSLRTLEEILALRRELRAERYDLCVDMQGLIRSAVIGWLAGAKEYVGFAAPREGPARWLYGRRVATREPHVVRRACELLGGAEGETLEPARVPLPVDAEAEAWCEGLLERVLPPGMEHFSMIAPTAGWGAKEWPPANYGRVAAALSKHGCRSLVNAASENNETVREVVEASDGGAVTVVCTMPQMIALLRRTSVMIAGDTGPLHLAAALGRPVVALFGPTDPARTGPYGATGEVLRNGASREDHRRHSVPEAGLLQITVEEVTAAALRTLAAESGPQGDV